MTVDLSLLLFPPHPWSHTASTPSQRRCCVTWRGVTASTPNIIFSKLVISEWMLCDPLPPGHTASSPELESENFWHLLETRAALVNSQRNSMSVAFSFKVGRAPAHDFCQKKGATNRGNLIPTLTTSDRPLDPWIHPGPPLVVAPGPNLTKAHVISSAFNWLHFNFSEKSDDLQFHGGQRRDAVRGDPHCACPDRTHVRAPLHGDRRRMRGLRDAGRAAVPPGGQPRQPHGAAPRIRRRRSSHPSCELNVRHIVKDFFLHVKCR